MAERLPDRPFTAARVGVDLGVRKRGEKAVEVPTDRARRGDQVGREPAIGRPGSKQPRRVDLGPLEDLVKPVDAIPGVRLAAADPRPFVPEGCLRDRDDVGDDRRNVGPRAANGGRQRAPDPDPCGSGAPHLRSRWTPSESIARRQRT
jgi:hypothetical protein